MIILHTQSCPDKIIPYNLYASLYGPQNYNSSETAQLYIPPTMRETLGIYTPSNATDND